MIKTLTLLALTLLTLPLGAHSVPAGKAEDVGLSSERLKRINQVVQRYMDSKEISGAVTVVARRGRIAHFEAQGLMNIESKTPMRKDAVFRIASMSKPVTAVAILMLMEEGALRLSDPVSRFIPEFKNTQVAMRKTTSTGSAAPVPGTSAPPPEIDLVPAAREVTIRDLLTHTSGLGSGGVAAAETTRVARRNSAGTVAEYARALGSAPLDFQPGSQWRYSALAGIDTLGRVVEVASGQTFDRFLQERIFGPLGMKDTTFVVPSGATARLVTLYERTPEGSLRSREVPALLASPTLFSGGGGLASTAEDYLQFAQMLVNGGQLNGVRLLSPRTVDLMASNHVGTLYVGTSGTARGQGFGLTVDVMLDPIEAGSRKSVGSFGWSGVLGTNFWVDRKEQLTAILMIQTPALTLRRDFENAVMQAIID